MKSSDYFFCSDFEKEISQEEILKFLEKIKSGDCESRNEVFVRSLRLVKYVLKGLTFDEYDRNDLFSVGCFGLLKAIDSYDENRKTNFSSYAICVIRNEILMFLRNERKFYSNLYSFEETIPNDDYKDNLKLQNILCIDDGNLNLSLENEVTNTSINDIVNSLGGMMAEVVKLRYGFYGKVHKQQEIADKLGVNQAYVSRLNKKAIMIIVKKLERLGLIELKESRKRELGL